MKECELCNHPARMYCESDQASLCWDCDAKVHSANFLVARHSRSLLCDVCQSPTPWNASGSKLGPTVAVCERCANNCNGRGERNGADVISEGANDGDDEIDGEQDDDDEEEEEETDDSEDEDEDEDGDVDDDESGENQVVPWFSTPPPPVTSCSSSDESSSNDRKRNIAESTFSLKRMRENADRCHDNLVCSFSHPNNDTSLAATGAGLSDSSCSPFSPSKGLKDPPEATAAAAVLCSHERFQHDSSDKKRS
ncbi:hypothetical protein NE237_031734 [Protea cynaroides]|uniref:B box-type domain-containing protein n=1 Tax=Protea cynaroides TaxID=273540 RepID=A0A9Q0L1Y8_9MAGN|nr:hypothetical protein NE237_031734 [Protea cynaroides]